MKIDVHCFLKESPPRFEIKASITGLGPLTFLVVVALPEMDDEQVLRLALDNTSFFLEREKITKATVNVCLDRPLRRGDISKTNESIDRLWALLAEPEDLQFEEES